MDELDEAARHLDRGLACRSRFDRAGARKEILLAAEGLFKAARRATGDAREVRIARAERLMRLADELREDVRADTGAQPVSLAEDERAGADDWLVSDRPALRFSDVAGLEEVKRQVHLKFIYPFSHHEQAARYRIRSGGGILLFGPPGTGKTLIARAVAGEISAAFFHVRPSDIMSRWVGEAEQNVNRLFEAARARKCSVIFIDEIESLLPKRRKTHSTVMARVVPQFLSELEGFEMNDTPILFIGATNEPWSLDAAALRPGRFDERIYVPLPGPAARMQILEQYLSGLPADPNLDLSAIAARLEGYSGADIANVCRKAIEIPFLAAVRTGDGRDLTEADFLRVIQEVVPSVSPKDLARYGRFSFGN